MWIKVPEMSLALSRNKLAEVNNVYPPCHESGFISSVISCLASNSCCNLEVFENQDNSFV